MLLLGLAMTDRSLTTGEGNTANWGVWLSDQQGLGGVKLTEEEAARLAHDLFAVLAECGRLREQLDAAETAVQRTFDMYEYAERQVGALTEQLDAARQALTQIRGTLTIDYQEWHVADAALGVEGPAAGDGQP